jgi:hypothetical protein
LPVRWTGKNEENAESDSKAEHLMPNDYSVEIHKYLSDKIRKAEQAVKLGDQHTAAHARGQLEELMWIRRYLRENIDLKNFVYY